MASRPRPTRTNSRKQMLTRSKSGRELGLPKEKRVDMFLQDLMESDSGSDSETVGDETPKGMPQKPPMLADLQKQLSLKLKLPNDGEVKRASGKRISSKRDSKKRSSTKRQSDRNSAKRDSHNSKASASSATNKSEDEEEEKETGEEKRSSGRQRWSVRANRGADSSKNGHGKNDSTIAAVSVRWLESFKSELCDDAILPEIKLGIVHFENASKESSSVRKLDGRTVQVINNLDADGAVKVKASGSSKCYTLNSSAVDIKDRHDWTVRDVAEYMLPADDSLLDGGVEDVGVSQPVTLVVHAHDSLFCDLIDALMQSVGKRNRGGGRNYVWLDVFCKRGAPKDAEYIHKNIKAGTFHNSVVYMDSLHMPLPLQRAWCLLEMHGCIKSKNSHSQMNFIFAPGWEKELMSIIGRKKCYRQFVELCDNVDVRSAHVSGATEAEADDARTKVLSALKDPKAANKLIAQSLKRCVVRAVEQAAEKVYPADSTSPSSKTANTLRKAGILLAELNEPSHALAMFKRSLDLEKSTSKRMVKTTRVAIKLQQQGMVADAKRMLEQALEIRIKPKDLDERTAVCLASIGTVLTELGALDKAASAFEASLAANQQVFGENDLKCATIHHNMAVLYLNRGEKDKAFSHCTQALEIRKEKLDSTDPKIATTLFSVGEVQRARKKFSKALQLYEKALKIYWKKNDELPFEIKDLTRPEGNWKPLLKSFEKMQRRSVSSVSSAGSASEGLRVEPLRVCEKVGAVFAAQGEMERALVTHSLTLAMAKSFLSDDDDLVKELLKGLDRFLEKSKEANSTAHDLVRKSLTMPMEPINPPKK